MKRLFIFITFLSIVCISFGQLNMELLGKLEYTNDISDIWGYVDETGNEYALVGAYEGLSIVNVRILQIRRKSISEVKCRQYGVI